MENGNAMTFTVTGAQPGEDVFLLFGTDEQVGAVCPPPLNGLCIDLQNARILGIPQNPLTADAAGTATITLNAPGPGVLPDGFVAWFQAVTTGATAATSNTIGKFNPLDDSGIMTIDIVEVADVVPGTSYDGNRFEIYYSAFNGLDLCVIEWEATSTGLGSLPPCAGCDFAFDVTYQNAIDSSSAGDCNYFFALDPTTLPAFNDGYGYNPNYYIPGYGYYPVAMFYYDNGMGSAYWTWSTTGVDYTAGEFVWLIDQIGFYYYP
jgi:hypothetical protein